MAKSKGTHFVVSASLTESGAPAYLTPRGWSTQLADASPFEHEADANARVQVAETEEQHIVSDPYTFSVTLEAGSPVPISVRESIRAEGPTVRVRRPDDVHAV